MEKKRHTLSWWLPGSSALLFLFIAVVGSLGALVFAAVSLDSSTLYWDSYIFSVLRFSCYQAMLSTFFALMVALPTALAFYYTDFKGKKQVLHCYSSCFFLPSIVIITGMLTLYGKEGIVTRSLQWLNLPSSFSLYGLKGIVFTHVFLNFPFALRFFYQALQSISSAQYKIAAQLGLNRGQLFRFVEFPQLLRPLLSSAVLIFMLCFSSFTIVLILGGGPKSSTLGVEVYQALRNLAFKQTLLLSSLQIVLCGALLLLSQFFLPQSSNQLKNNELKIIDKPNRYLTFFYYSLLFLSGVFLFPPLFVLIYQGIVATLFYHPPALLLLQATLTSLFFAFFAALLSVTLCFFILKSNQFSPFKVSKKWHTLFELSGMLTLAIPANVLIAGYVVIYYQLPFSIIIDGVLLILTHALIALPFLLKILSLPMQIVENRYHYLLSSLNLHGFSRFMLIDFPLIKKELSLAFAYAMLFSLSDVGLILFINSPSVTTLSYLLYQQLASYQIPFAHVTASALLLLSLAILMLTNWQTKKASLN